MIESIDRVVNAIGGFLYRPYIVPLFLLAAGLYFTIRTGLIQFRLFGESIRVVKEKPKEKGSISSFGALMVSTASRVGTGNIVGVSTAICLGGFGAVFWMWVVALVGGASAFIESALAQVYKKRDADGSSYGGPSYYMEQALHQRWLGIVFAVVLILTYVVGFNMLAAYNLQDAFGGFSFYVKGRTPYIIGAILAVLFALCVLGGRQAPDQCHGRARAGHGSAVYRDVARRRVHEHQDLPERHRQHLPRCVQFQGGVQRLHRLLHHVGHQARPVLQRGRYGLGTERSRHGRRLAPGQAGSCADAVRVHRHAAHLLGHGVHVPVLRRCPDARGRRRRLCAGVRAAVARQLRPDLHRHLHVPVCVHDAHRQLLLLRGLPEVHPQARPEQSGHDGVPCACVSDRVRRRDGQRPASRGIRPTCSRPRWSSSTSPSS